MLKYQVFISSTFDDLHAERDQVIKAILELGHIPVGMEMFSAADEEQWKLISRQISEVDYYLVIVAHRYGSTVGGVSYTEKEYDYAISQGVPILGFVLDPTASWPRNRIDTEEPAVSALEQFKQKVTAKPVSFWKSADELNAKVSIALIKAISSSPRPGWVRASTVPSNEAMAELSRLSQENAKLERESELRQLTETLLAIPTKVPIWYRGAADWDWSVQTSLWWVFTSVGPRLQAESKLEDLASYLAYQVAAGRKVNEKWPIASNTIQDWLADFASFELVQPSMRKHPVSDEGEYWSLTDYGRALLSRARRSALESKAKNAPSSSDPPNDQAEKHDDATPTD